MSDKETTKKRKVGDGTPGPGRPKGVPNKVTADVKAMVLQALSEAGGAAYLLEQSEKNPTAFMTLVGKVLPLTVAGDPDAPLTFQEVVRRIVKPA
jgi:hypothetical protein